MLFTFLVFEAPGDMLCALVVMVCAHVIWKTGHPPQQRTEVVTEPLVHFLVLKGRCRPALSVITLRAPERLLHSCQPEGGICVCACGAGRSRKA